MKKTVATTVMAFGVATVFMLGSVGCADDGSEFGQSTEALKGPSIVDTALAVNDEGSPYAGMFDTLIAAVLVADPIVLETLSDRGQFTVFAPTDDAFAELGLNPDNVIELDEETLTEILLYHVAHGNRDAADVLDSDRIRMLNRGWSFPAADGTLTDANGRVANIIVTDVEAKNGVIHVINKVILP